MENRRYYFKLFIDRLCYARKTHKLADELNVEIKRGTGGINLYIKITKKDKQRVYKTYKDIYLVLRSIKYFEDKEDFIAAFDSKENI